jgi:hypothetical protein
MLEQVNRDDVVAGHAAFILAQALLDALVTRGHLSVRDVAPSLQQVIEDYRRSSLPDPGEIKVRVAHVLDKVLEIHERPRG